MENNYIQGTPSMVMLPAKNFIFKIDKDNFIMRLPRKGSYHELAPDLFKEEDGEFNIYDEESKILYLPSITKVLFAMSHYPDLEFNQFFCPSTIKFEKEEVVVVGQIINLMLPVKEDGTLNDGKTESEEEGE